MLKKIHLCCGNNLIKGWENFDLEPITGAKHINLLETFPFKDNSVDYIILEHALEHFDEVDGFSILRELNRVLKPGGVCRISTPSLNTYINRFINWEHPNNEVHCRQFSTRARFINYAFYGESVATHGEIKFLDGKSSFGCGHKYIYDFEDLENKLQEIGFSKIESCNRNHSSRTYLKNLDTRPDNGDIIIDIYK